jgi:hypothetical protein
MSCPLYFIIKKGAVAKCIKKLFISRNEKAVGKLGMGPFLCMAFLLPFQIVGQALSISGVYKQLWADLPLVLHVYNII